MVASGCALNPARKLARSPRTVSVRHVEADSQPSKKSKKSGGNGSVALLKEFI